MGLAVSILASALLISAQTGDPLASGIQLYDQRAFAEALQSFTKALDRKNTPRERARIHMYIGLIQVHYELVDDARASFEAAIARDARVALPSQADARARKLFRELKKDAP